MSEPKKNVDDTEAYERAACEALGLAYWKDIKSGVISSLHHHLGTFKVSESEGAALAVVNLYREQVSSEFYTYREYLRAIRNASSIRSELKREEGELIREAKQEAKRICDERDREIRQSEKTDREIEKARRHNDRVAESGKGSYVQLPGLYVVDYEHYEARGEALVEEYQTDLEDLRERRKRERDFTADYSYEDNTPDLRGYLYYLSCVQFELFLLLDIELPAYVPEAPRYEHSYVVAATGGGKSELLKVLIHSYVSQPKAKGAAGAVVLDPNGDFVSQIAKWPEFVGFGGERLIYLEHDLKPGKTFTINPLQIAGLDPKDVSAEALDKRRLVARQLLGAFEQVISGRQGSNITTPMEAVLIPCMLTLFEQPGATLRDLARFMDDERNGDLVAKGAAREHDPDNAAFFQHTFEHKRFQVTKGSIQTKLQTLLSTGFFADMTCGENTVDLAKAMDERKIVLFNLRQGKLDDISAAFGRLLVATIQGIANTRDEIAEEHRVPCHLVIDECHNFITASIRKLMLEARKFRVYCTLCQQIPGENMSREMKQVVLESANVFHVGRARKGGHLEPANLADVEPDDMLTLGKGQFFIRAGNNPPFRLHGRKELLGFNHCMSDAAWQRRVDWQIEDYYRDREQPFEKTDKNEAVYEAADTPLKDTDTFV